MDSTSLSRLLASRLSERSGCTSTAGRSSRRGGPTAWRCRRWRCRAPGRRPRAPARRTGSSGRSGPWPARSRRPGSRRSSGCFRRCCSMALARPEGMLMVPSGCGRRSMWLMAAPCGWAECNSRRRSGQAGSMLAGRGRAARRVRRRRAARRAASTTVAPQPKRATFSSKQATCAGASNSTGCSAWGGRSTASPSAPWRSRPRPGRAPSGGAPPVGPPRGRLVPEPLLLAQHGQPRDAEGEGDQGGGPGRGAQPLARHVIRTRMGE